MLGLLRRRKTVIFNNVLIIKRTEDVRIREINLLRNIDGRRPRTFLWLNTILKKVRGDPAYGGGVPQVPVFRLNKRPTLW